MFRLCICTWVAHTQYGMELLYFKFVVTDLGSTYIRTCAHLHVRLPGKDDGNNEVWGQSAFSLPVKESMLLNIKCPCTDLHSA